MLVVYSISIFYFLIMSNKLKSKVNNSIENIIELLRRLFANGYQSLFGFTAGFFALFAPAVPVLITVIAFILADTYYGYKVSKQYGNKLESHKLWKTCHKIRDVFIVITLGLLLDKFILNTYDDLAAVKISAGTVCVAESVSLLESFRALHPRALLSKLLAKVIKSKAEKYLDVDLSDIVDLKDITDDTIDIKNNNK